MIDFTERTTTGRCASSAAGGADDDAPGALADKVVGVQRDTVNQPSWSATIRTPSAPALRQPGARALDLGLGRLDAVLGEAVQLDAGFLKTPAGEGFAFFGGGISTRRSRAAARRSGCARRTPTCATG